MNHGEILEGQKPRKFARGKHGELDDSLGESWIKIALGLREDLLKKCVDGACVSALAGLLTRHGYGMPGYLVLKWKK